MSGMYKDAKDWLSNLVDDGVISADQLVSFIYGYTSNDDIETYFGVSMDREEDNPGVEDKECQQCGREVGPDDYDAEREMCLDCSAEVDESETEEPDQDELDGLYDEEATIPVWVAGTLRTIWLRPADIDYDYTQDKES